MSQQRGVRAWVGNLGRRLSEWSTNEQWRDAEPGRTIELEPQARIRRRPVRFEDLDKAEALINLLMVEGETNLHIASRDRNYMPGMELREALEAIAQQTTTRDAYVRIWDPSSVIDRWAIQFGSQHPNSEIGDSVGVSGSGDPWLTARLIELVDRHTVPMTRSEHRRGVPVFSPLRAVGAAQQAHERELARSAKRAGALWGVVAGLVSGPASTLVAHWVSN